MGDGLTSFGGRYLRTFTIRYVYEPLAKRSAKRLVAVHGLLKHWQSILAPCTKFLLALFFVFCFALGCVIVGYFLHNNFNCRAWQYCTWLPLPTTHSDKCSRSSGFLFLKICVRLIKQTLPYARTSISMQAQSLLWWVSLRKQDIYVCSPR